MAEALSQAALSAGAAAAAAAASAGGGFVTGRDRPEASGLFMCLRGPFLFVGSDSCCFLICPLLLIGSDCDSKVVFIA